MSTALGDGAVAAFANSTAIGQGAATTRANQMVFGTGDQRPTPRPASRRPPAPPPKPDRPQLVTSDASGNLATESASNIVTSSPAFQSLQSDVRKNTQGVAVAWRWEAASATCRAARISASP